MDVEGRCADIPGQGSNLAQPWRWQSDGGFCGDFSSRSGHLCLGPVGNEGQPRLQGLCGLISFVRPSLISILPSLSSDWGLSLLPVVYLKHLIHFATRALPLCHVLWLFVLQLKSSQTDLKLPKISGSSLFFFVSVNHVVQVLAHSDQLIDASREDW